MSSKNKVKLAKEIKTVFQMLIIGLALGCLYSGAYYLINEPPMIDQFSIDEKTRLKNELQQVYDGVRGDVQAPSFEGNKYDGALYIKDYLRDNVNWKRKTNFDIDMKNVFHKSLFYTPFILILLRYIYLTYDWVQKTSKE